MPRDKKETADDTINLVVIGTAGCGKSCITIRFIANRFVEGIEEFPTVRDGYVREADGFLCVYAITTAESFREVEELHSFVMRVKEDNSQRKIPFVICGNKCDLEEARVVSKEKGEALASKLGVIFYETSALSGKNIEGAFHELVRSVRREREKMAKLNQPEDDTASNSSKTKTARCCVIL